MIPKIFILKFDTFEFWEGDNHGIFSEFRVYFISLMADRYQNQNYNGLIFKFEICGSNCQKALNIRYHPHPSSYTTF